MLRQPSPICRLVVYRDRADVRFAAPRRVSTHNSLQQPTRNKTPALPPPPGTNMPLPLTYLPAPCDSSQTDSRTNTIQSRDSSIAKQTALADAAIEREERLRVILYKQPDKQLGIKLAHKRTVESGLFVAGLVADSLAVIDGRLKKDDRVIEINGIDMAGGTKERAAQLIQSASTSVELVVIRKTRAQTPDILRQTGVPTPSGVKLDGHAHSSYPPVPENQADTDADSAKGTPSTPSKLRSRGPLPQRAVVPLPVPVPLPLTLAATSPPRPGDVQFELGSDQNNNDDDNASSADFPPPPPELSAPTPDPPRPPVPDLPRPPLPSSAATATSTALVPHKGSPQHPRVTTATSPTSARPPLTLSHHKSATAQSIQPQTHAAKSHEHREKGCDSMLKRGALSLNLKLSNLLGRARHDGASATDEDSKDDEPCGRDKCSKDDKTTKPRRSKSLLRRKKTDSKATDSPAKSKHSGKGKPLKSAPSSPTLQRRSGTEKGPDDAEQDGRRSRHARSQANLNTMSGLSKSQSIVSRAQYAELMRLSSSSCREKIVDLHKSGNESLGMSVAGGLHSQRGDIPIYVTNVQEDSCAARSQRIARGDVVLSVNQRVLLGLTHDQAVQALRTESQTRSRLVLKLIESPEPANSPENFMPSWLFWLRLPPYCQIPKLIELERDRHTDSLGFAIIGGVDLVPLAEADEEREAASSSKRKSSSKSTPQTPTSRTAAMETRQMPIVVRSIVPDSPAAVDGRLRCGDLILALNSFALDALTHQQVVALLKQLPSPVLLTVVSWPGTIV